jgi:hypothetical protein
VNEKTTPYRTVFTTLMLGLGVCILAGVLHKNEVEARVFETAAWVLFAMSLPQAAKSGIEALAKGTGVKGAVSALMTETKPGEPAP